MINDNIDRRDFLVASGIGLAALAGRNPVAQAVDLAPLRAAIRGRVLLPGDPQFDAARTPWNLTVDQSVLAVAEVADADDAATLVRYARDAGISLATQLNGHGASAAIDGTILVRTTRLRQVDIDSAGTATAGAGASWGDVQAQASPLGMTGVAGSSPAVGVTGYTLGGGLSWFSRNYGWAADSVTAFDVVTSTGDRLRITESQEPELFWALRGGGGDFAMVTALQFRLKPAPALYGGHLMWPVSQASAVLDAFTGVTASAPDELSVWCGISRFPGGPAMVGIDTTYLGDAASASEFLKPFDAISGRLADTRRPLPVAELGSVTDEPVNPTAARQRSTVVTHLPDAFVDDLVNHSIDPLVFVQIRHLGGALSRPTGIPSGTAPGQYFVNFGGHHASPGLTTAFDARVNSYLDLLGPADTHRTPFNFLTPTQSAAESFDPATLARLRAAKTLHDPNGIFRSNHPVIV